MPETKELNLSYDAWTEHTSLSHKDLELLVADAAAMLSRPDVLEALLEGALVNVWLKYSDERLGVKLAVY